MNYDGLKILKIFFYFLEYNFSKNDDLCNEVKKKMLEKFKLKKIFGC